MRTLLLTFFLLFHLSVYAQQMPWLQTQETPQQESLRGLCVLSDSIAWASGTNGTFLRTFNGGISWEVGKVQGADSLDFRDVHAFSYTEALLVSAGQPARIYRTTDGGKSWHKVLEDITKKAFFDAVAFQNGNDGLVMSDPVGDSFLLYYTQDGGWTWEKIRNENIPPAEEGEAGFAASGTGLVVVPGLALFGTGGTAVRVFRSTDGGKSWEVHATPMEPETSSTGIYSMAMKDKQNGLALGGDYTRPDATSNHLLLTRDGGRTWQRKDGSGLGGYRSGVAYVPGTAGTYVAVGTNGMDISFDNGSSWKPLSTTGMHAVQFAPSGKTGWTSGANGKLIRIQFN